jgi:hypothetical protein
VEIDRGLNDAVDAFVAELEPILDEVAGELPDVKGDDLRQDLVVEAYNLSLAFIDCDDRHSDDELLALIAAFAGRLDTQLDSASPADIRADGLLDDKREWLDHTSVLFDLLLGSDARHGTSHAHRYYERAMAVAHTVASLDAHPSESELRALEDFRGQLLRAMAGIRVRPPEPLATAAPSGSGPWKSQDLTTPRAQNEEEGVEDPPARPIEDLLQELDDLVGLTAVKDEVKLVANLIRVQNLRRDRGLPVHETSRHLVFTGNPGTGKTTVARLVAQIYRTLGVVERGHLVETDRSKLVVGYIGQTATRVREVFDSADEGVLLIDEAYALARGGEKDFGLEAIDTIVKLVEDRRDSVVVIVAGYPDEMREFVDANPGLRSRFPRTIFFPDYSDEELVRIFTTLAEDGGYLCPPETLARVAEWFGVQPRTKGFGNGRLARNLFEDALGRHATRIVAVADPSDEQLCTLAVDDIAPPAPVPT